jgi:hypothetical protein
VAALFDAPSSGLTRRFIEGRLDGGRDGDRDGGQA